MTTERIIRAEEKGWALTDDDCFQWQRGVIKQERPFAQCFEMCQITKIGDEYRVCHGVVVINDVPYPVAEFHFQNDANEKFELFVPCYWE